MCTLICQKSAKCFVCTKNLQLTCGFRDAFETIVYITRLASSIQHYHNFSKATQAVKNIYIFSGKCIFSTRILHHHGTLMLCIQAGTCLYSSCKTDLFPVKLKKLKNIFALLLLFSVGTPNNVSWNVLDLQ